ncbi:MAG: 4-hydroxybenzoate octaprenyltransferase [Phycisphaerae bacterium]|jgi:4-hydroxybenzoate polyprenyltransferase|nr:MAG: 4-hydroxybenzoate octaprenyltransferase [Phycisphaerae bacterium]
MPQPLVRAFFFDRLIDFAADIKLSHSVFALPWAILAMVMASRQNQPPVLYLGQILLIVLCMVTARTVAMGMNRILDASLDQLNPRTARRAIPSGRLSIPFFTSITIACALGFVVSCIGFGIVYQNWIPLIAAGPVLIFISFYPLLKRFTRWCHYYLGAALGLAPVCSWVAISGSLSLEPWIMMAAVLFWTAGFDIIYACQDYDSDRVTGVFSIPARMGIVRALWVSRMTHLLCLVCLVLLGWYSPLLGGLFAIGVVLAAGLLVTEHLLVKAQDLSKVNTAFFTFNSMISTVLGVMGLADVLLSN